MFSDKIDESQCTNEYKLHEFYVFQLKLKTKVNVSQLGIDESQYIIEHKLFRRMFY